VEHGALLRDVDPLAPEHRVDPRSQGGLLRQPDQQAERLFGDAVLRVVEVEADGLHGEALAAPRVVREERAQVRVPDLAMVGLEGLPCRACAHELAAGRHPFAPPPDGF
jgi:hypothetical protein